MWAQTGVAEIVGEGGPDERSGARPSPAAIDVVVIDARVVLRGPPHQLDRRVGETVAGDAPGGARCDRVMTTERGPTGPEQTSGNEHEESSFHSPTRQAVL